MTHSSDLVILCNYRLLALRGDMNIQAAGRAGERELTSHLAAIVESSEDAIIGKTLEGVITSWNHAAAAMYGYTAEEMVGRNVSVLFPADRAGELAPILAALRRGERVEHFETRRVRKDRTVIDVSVSVSPVRDASGRVVEAATVARDVTERNHAARAASELGSRLAAIVESSEDAIIGATLEGVITSWNPGAAVMYGYTAEEMVGRDASMLVPPDRAGELVAVLERLRRGERVAPFETQRVRKDGALVDVSVAVSPVRDADEVTVAVAIMVRNVTDRNRMLAERRASEARLRQAERMETVGQLAGGIAHDFNSLLGAITGFAGLVADASADRPEVRADAEQILTVARRAARLTRELLIFSRREPAQPELIDLNAVIVGVDDLLAISLGGRVELRFELAAEVPEVLADRGQMEQALLNLAVNARDAMPGGGTLTLATGQADLGRGHPGARPGLSPGCYAELTVSDTGCGMSAEVAQRAFEPFFTTKPLGEGAGLGLATAFGIVTQAGGTISIDSEEGTGTVFHVYLPAASTPRQAQAGGPEDAAPAGGNGERVLVVDDEPALLTVTARILRSNGYQVLEADSCGEALALISAHEFELLLTDAVMPGMSGPELAERALGIRPGLRVLHMSGSTQGVLNSELVASGEIAFIAKPFTARALLEKARAVLGPARAG
jgi:PAS domain S-box-containing protein